ncbi:MAG: HAD family phosphatase [Clostridiales bacterium]|nr:HAD family phosphatase [Clostridiales bacterium]
MPINAVIFDMDGVLIDSEPIYFGELEKFLKSIDIACVKNEGTAYLGLNRKSTALKIKELHPSLSLTAEELEKQLIVLHNECLPSCADKLVLIHGFMPFIRSIKAAGFKTAVASSSSYETVHFVIDHFHLESYFNAIVTGSEIKKSKPNPEIFLLAASEIGISPQECMVIEDSENGIRAAKAASMLCYGFCGTNHFNSDFSLADFVFSTYDQEILDKILSQKK